jgi:hypothetical protein
MQQLASVCSPTEDDGVGVAVALSYSGITASTESCGLVYRRTVVLHHPLQGTSLWPLDKFLVLRHKFTLYVICLLERGMTLILSDAVSNTA